MAAVRRTLEVEGIHCLRCPPKIGLALEGVPGVLGASASLAGEVAVVYDADVPDVLGEVVAALATAGFPVVSGGPGPGAPAR